MLRRCAKRAMLVLAAGAIAAADLAPAAAENTQVAARRAAERRHFSDAEIVAGFFKIAFGAELHVAGRVDRIRKFDGPVRVFIDGAARSSRRRQLAGVIADIRRHVAHLDIALTDARNAANVLVRLVRDRDLSRALRLAYGRDRARRIERSLEPQCLSGFRKDGDYRIVHSDVFLVIDVGDFTFLDCAYEELLQALGPINDDPSVPWTMFNDEVQMGFFGVYDQYLLNILYHPRVRPGMTRTEVQALLPEILPEIRSFVAEANDLGPGP